METQNVELEGDIISPTREVVSSYIDTDPSFVVASPEPHALTSEDMQEPASPPARRQSSTASNRDLRRQNSDTCQGSKRSQSKSKLTPRSPRRSTDLTPPMAPSSTSVAQMPSTNEIFMHNQGMRDILSSHSTKPTDSYNIQESFLKEFQHDDDETRTISDDGEEPKQAPLAMAPRAPSSPSLSLRAGSRLTSPNQPMRINSLGGLEGTMIGGLRPGSSSNQWAPLPLPLRLLSPSSLLSEGRKGGLLPPIPSYVTLPSSEKSSMPTGAAPFMERQEKAPSPTIGPWGGATSPSPGAIKVKGKDKVKTTAPATGPSSGPAPTISTLPKKPLFSQSNRRFKGGASQSSMGHSIQHSEAWTLGELEEDFKRVTAVDQNRKGSPNSKPSSQRIMAPPPSWNEDMQEKLNGLVVVKGSKAENGSIAQVPRQKKQIESSPSSLSKAALRQLHDLGLSGPEPKAKIGLLNRQMIEEGARRRRAAEVSQKLGPPKFVRKSPGPPRPYSPSGATLDGFTLLAAGDEETPDRVVAARLSNRGFTKVEEGDMAYFPLLRALDLSDNKLTNMGCLSPLFGLQVLNLAHNRLTQLESDQAGAGSRERKEGELVQGPWFEEIQVLDLSFNSLPATVLFGRHSPLADLPFLRDLDLTGNSLTDLPDPIGSFPALRILRLDGNRMHGGVLEALGLLPGLAELYLSNNVITGIPEEATDPGRFPELQLLDLTHNRISDSSVVDALRLLPRLKELLIHGNPLALRILATEKKQGSSTSTTQAQDSSGLKIHCREVSKLPPKITIASVLSANFFTVDSPLNARTANMLAINAASGATEGAVDKAFERLDDAIESWKLGTVAEGEEEEEEEEEAAMDSTFLTGVGIEEKKSKRKAGGKFEVNEQPSAEFDGDDEVESSSFVESKVIDDRPLWADIEDPTERLALALGLDPSRLAFHTGRLTSDSMATVNALRFALSHSLVNADEGMGSPNRLLTSTTASRMKRRDAGQKLMPLLPSPLKAKATVKIETVDMLLSGMKQRLQGLEASLAEKLALVPASLTRQPIAKDDEFFVDTSRLTAEDEDNLQEAAANRPSEEDRPMSPLGSDTIDAIENPHLSDGEEEEHDGEGGIGGAGPLAAFDHVTPPLSLTFAIGGSLLGY